MIFLMQLKNVIMKENYLKWNNIDFLKKNYYIINNKKLKYMKKFLKWTSVIIVLAICALGIMWITETRKHMENNYTETTVEIADSIVADTLEVVEDIK